MALLPTVRRRATGKGWVRVAKHSLLIDRKTKNGSRERKMTHRLKKKCCVVERVVLKLRKHCYDLEDKVGIIGRRAKGRKGRSVGSIGADSRRRSGSWNKPMVALVFAVLRQFLIETGSTRRPGRDERRAKKRISRCSKRLPYRKTPTTINYNRTVNIKMLLL